MSTLQALGNMVSDAVSQFWYWVFPPKQDSLKDDMSGTYHFEAQIPDSNQILLTHDSTISPVCEGIEQPVPKVKKEPKKKKVIVVSKVKKPKKNATKK